MSCAIRYSGKAMRRKILAGEEPEWLLKHPRCQYVKQAYLSCPEWADRAELKWLDWCRRAWSILTGVEHVLDHIVPLNHPRVCGLTVPWNFRIVPRPVNAFKGGHWCEAQGSLFEEESHEKETHAVSSAQVQRSNTRCERVLLAGMRGGGGALDGGASRHGCDARPFEATS